MLCGHATTVIARSTRDQDRTIVGSAVLPMRRTRLSCWRNGDRSHRTGGRAAARSSTNHAWRGRSAVGFAPPHPRAASGGGRDAGGDQRRLRRPPRTGTRTRSVGAGSRCLARALRLDLDGRNQLFHLAGVSPPGPGTIDMHVRPSVLRLIDRFADLPVVVMSAKGDVLAWNAMASALHGDWSALPPHRRNINRLRFLPDPADPPMSTVVQPMKNSSDGGTIGRESSRRVGPLSERLRLERTCR